MRVLMWVGVLVVAAVPFAAMADERELPEAPQKVTIRLSEYKFEPARVEVRRGQPVELHLVNSGTVLHEFVGDLLAKTTVDVESGGAIALVHGIEELEVLPGSSVVLRFTPQTVGEFPFQCDAEDPVSHHEEGMKGTLVVR